MYSGVKFLPPSRLKTIFRFRTGLGSLAKNPHKTFTSCFSSSSLEEIGRGLGYAHFFSDGHSDPLVQGHAIFLCEALRSLLD
jgi:hypothetical protein